MFSILLQDVHEIQSGVDWQDSLNFAVSGCEVFVPLVTARYGETQWTNREVLNKNNVWPRRWIYLSMIRV